VAKILLIAPTVDETDVGEAWVGFQWVKRLSERHDVTLLTYHKRGRSPVSEQLPGVRVIEWVETPLVGRAERLNSMLKPAYIPFYFKARRWIKKALAAGETWDVAHQPVPVAMRYPCPATGLGMPVIMGPVGGGLDSPPGFDDEDTAPWYVGLRSLDRFRIRRDPALRKTYAQAACVLGIAPYTQELLSDIPLRRFEVMGETGLNSVPEPIEHDENPEVVRLLFVGRVIRTKGTRDAIAAMAHLKDLPVRLDVIGDGFDRETCEQLARDLELGDRVVFHGRLPHDIVMRRYADADIFVFPSFREPGGNVMYEAMGASLPQIVVDRGGPGHAVDETCGIKLQAENPAQLAQAIADAVRTLVEDPQKRLAMGRAALVRLREIGLWESKFDRIDALYREVSN
jgi:glycosyltransferase involved in cell wall biosynthesis